MKARYRTRRKENRFGVLLAATVVLLLTFAVSVRSIDLLRQVGDNEARIEELQTQMDKEKQRSAEIDEFVKETQTRKYIEDIARQKLGLVYPGEIIFEKESN